MYVEDKNSPGRCVLNKIAVLMGLGRDSIGFVAEVTHHLYEEGLNLLDSSMTLLRGEFAMVLMVELPENASLSQLEARMKDLEKQLDMKIHVRLLSQEELQEPDVENGYMISIYGADKPGIVAHATRALANAGLNITDMQTKLTGQGTKIFVMILEVTAPPSVSAETIRKLLEKTTTQFGVDVTVNELETTEL
jgi:glycine cleavage system transcriptional repressor